MDFELRERVLNDWFVEGIHRGARYMIVVFDQGEQEERPIFVFPEQDIQVEVVKQISSKLIQLRGVLDLIDDPLRQIAVINLPDNMVVSRVVN